MNKYLITLNFLFTLAIGIGIVSCQKKEPTAETLTPEPVPESVTENQTSDSVNSKSLEPVTKVSPEVKKGKPIEVNPHSKNISNQQAEQKTLEPGPYCYQYEDENLSAKAELLVTADKSVTGKIEGSIHNQEADYYTSYIQSFSGIVKDTKLEVYINTEIENDQQKSQENWTLKPEILKTEKETFNQVDCATFIGNNYPESNQEDSARTIRVKFDPGTNSKVIEDAVVRGTRDIYLVNAQANQDMNLLITSLEDNAVFDVIAPNGEPIEGEITNLSFTLPMSGDYQIIVGGTRGNATYKLKIEIK